MSGLVKYTRDERTAEQVERLAQIGARKKDIAYVLGLTYAELMRDYSQEIERGSAHLRIQLQTTQTMLALKGSERMLIWLGKNKLGQSDAVTPYDEHDDHDGASGPIIERHVFTHNINPADDNDDDGGDE